LFYKCIVANYSLLRRNYRLLQQEKYASTSQELRKSLDFSLAIRSSWLYSSSKSFKDRTAMKRQISKLFLIYALLIALWQWTYTNPPFILFKLRSSVANSTIFLMGNKIYVSFSEFKAFPDPSSTISSKKLPAI
jgi:hypothetical protein